MSKLSDEILNLLKETFPHAKIKEEYKIKYLGKTLFVDFYIPSFSLAVEVHGVQHDKFVPHFHGDAAGWKSHKNRDRIKEEWADINNVSYIVIREGDKPKNKEEMLERCLGGY